MTTLPAALLLAALASPLPPTPAPVVVHVVGLTLQLVPGSSARVVVSYHPIVSASVLLQQVDRETPAVVLITGCDPALSVPRTLVLHDDASAEQITLPDGRQEVSWNAGGSEPWDRLADHLCAEAAKTPLQRI